jgi:hypothetical protein
MKLTKEYVVETSSELVVVEFNPEMADVTNPRGEIVGEVFFVRITDNSTGNRWRHHINFAHRQRAEKLAERVRARGGITDKFWFLHYPVYGSLAYCDGIEEEIALEKKRAIIY